MKHLLYLTVFLILLTVSCRKEESTIDIVLPETSVISSNSRWGVVKDPYVRVRKSPDEDDIISSAFRQGDIVKILKSTEFATTSGGEDIYWFYTVMGDVEGWVIGADLKIFESKEQARTASKMFK